MEEIRSWWEVPCVSHFCKIFSKPFKLPEFEIEELEDALLLDMNPDPSSLLVQLFVIFLNGIVDRDITEDNWQSFLKLHVRWRCDFLHEKWDPFQSKGCDYSGLAAREKIELLHKLCHWRLELDDVGDLVRGYDGPSLRLTPLGRDGDGFLYWFFYGTRLYREAPSRRPVRKKKNDETGRGRGKNTPAGRKKPVTTPQRKGVGSRASRGQSTRRTPSSRGRGRRAAAKEDSSDGEESHKEGQCSNRRRPSNRRCEQLATGDDEGYEGSGEEGGVGRGRGRRRGRAAAPPERPVEDMRKDDVSGNKTPPVAPATSPVKESEEKMETEVKEEGEGRVEEGREGEMKEEEMKMDVYEGALAANTNNNSNKRSGGEEGGSGEEEEEGNRRRSLRTRNRQSQKVLTPEKDQSPAKGVGEGREEGESGEKGEEEESEEDDDAIDWQPVAGRGRGRGKSQSVRGRRRRHVEASEGESEEEGEEVEQEKEEKDEKEAGEKKREKWQIVCSTVEEWEELVTSLSTVRTPSVRKLYHALEELLPHAQYLFRERDKELKRKMIAELPRRTSDRIALKAQQEEEERLEAQMREHQRQVLRQEREEEQRRKEDEAEEKRQKRREEAILRKKAREEEQMKVREEEEKNWQQAMSGELSGPRKAALGAAEGVSEVINAVEGEGGLDGLGMEDEKEEFLYTAFYKVLSGLRRQEDSWVFEDPVTESIAPGYHEQISMPMDYSTVESRLEKKHYSTRDEFETDIKLIFNNCIEYNGEDSEYSELATQMLAEFEKLCKVHLDGGGVKAEPEVKMKGSRSSRSPSVCKTPELTSESSSEEASDGDSDESYSEGTGKPKKKASGGGGQKPLLLTPKLSQLPNSAGHLPPRPPHPYFQQQMMMQYRMRYEGQHHMAPPHPEMMFRPPPYGRLPPPPPYSPHPHMPRPPPDHHFPPYPHHYPPHYSPSPYHHHSYRHGFPPHMIPPRPHLSPSASGGRPGSVPPGQHSIPSGRSSAATPPTDPSSIPASGPSSIPHSSELDSAQNSNASTQDGGSGSVVEKKDDKQNDKEKEEEGENEKKAKEGEEKKMEENKQEAQSSAGRETVAENGASPSRMVHSGPPPHALHQMSKQQQAASGPPPPPPHALHQMSKQQEAAYRYHHQMMRGGHTHPDFYHHYPHGYDPRYPPRHPYPSPPPHSSHQPTSHHPDPYYAWHHQQQAMYGREVRADIPPDELRHHQQQMYLIEMERRRQYFMYMQQRAKAAQMGQNPRPVAISNKQDRGMVGSNKNKEEEEEKSLAEKNTTGEGEGKEESKNGASEERKTDGGEGKETTPPVEEDKKEKTAAEEEETAPVANDRNEQTAEGEKKTAEEKTTEAPHPPHPVKELSREMMYRQRPPPFPSHNGHPGMEGADMYPFPQQQQMYPPHMYGMPPPGYAMRPHPSNYGPHQTFNDQGIPAYQSPAHDQGVADGNTPKSANKQGIPPTQHHRGFPPGYGPRPEHDMRHPRNEQGFPPGYGPWPRHHGYPPPTDPGMMSPEMRERWKAEQASHYRHVHPHQYMHYQYRMPTGQRLPHPPPPTTPQKRSHDQTTDTSTTPSDESPSSAQAPPTKRAKASTNV